MTYRGRFAPSPTGHLHFGSLVAAVGSYLQAKTARGQWLIRIEDIDTPRVMPGAADSILKSLDWLGFEWDGPVVCQSNRVAAYNTAFEQLQKLDLVYPCSCSRSELMSVTSSVSNTHSDPLVGASMSLESDELRYPGFCRQQPRHMQNEYAWRFRVPADAIHYHDAIHGELSTNLDTSIGDFVVKRRDSLFAYQLAVVVDDAAQDISEVVRGGDLLSNTPRQIALQRALKLPTPNYVHLPVALDASGKKLSKSQQAPHLDGQNNGKNGSELLYRALDFLKQAPPINLQRASIAECWQWAIDNWQLKPLILS